MLQRYIYTSRGMERSATAGGFVYSSEAEAEIARLNKTIFDLTAEASREAAKCCGNCGNTLSPESNTIYCLRNNTREDAEHCCRAWRER